MRRVAGVVADQGPRPVRELDAGGGARGRGPEHLAVQERGEILRVLPGEHGLGVEADRVDAVDLAQVAVVLAAAHPGGELNDPVAALGVLPELGVEQAVPYAQARRDALGDRDQLRLLLRGTEREGVEVLLEVRAGHLHLVGDAHQVERPVQDHPVEGDLLAREELLQQRDLGAVAGEVTAPLLGEAGHVGERPLQLAAVADQADADAGGQRARLDDERVREGLRGGETRLDTVDARELRAR